VSKYLKYRAGGDPSSVEVSGATETRRVSGDGLGPT
jgi:hypothetical protein